MARIWGARVESKEKYFFLNLKMLTTAGPQASDHHHSCAREGEEDF